MILPNQDCDHFVGYAESCRGSRCLHYDQSWIEDKWDLRDIDERFNYCPNCGEKIDWAAIEKHINASA